MPALACSMKKVHQQRRHGRRRGLLMASFISRELKRLTAPSRHYCARSCSRTQYRKQLHQHYLQKAMPLPPTTLHGFMTQRDLILLLIITHPPCPHHSRHQHLTRTCFHTCHHGTIQISPVIRHHPGRPKAGMVQTLTQDLKCTVFRRYGLAVSRCSSVPGGNQELYPRYPTKFWMPPNWQTISI